MKSTASRNTLVLLSLSLCACSVSQATRIPQPDIVVYGTVKIDHRWPTLSQDVTVVARRYDVDSNEVAEIDRYRLREDDRIDPCYYVIRIPVEEQRDPDTDEGLMVFAGSDTKLGKAELFLSARVGDGPDVNDVEIVADLVPGLVLRRDIDYYKDTDKDGLPDSWERAWGLDPDSNDTDLDGLSDWEEVSYDGDPNSYLPYSLVSGAGTDLNAKSTDTDGDGMGDALEKYWMLNPLRRDSHEDVDGDGYLNWEELARGSDPNDSTDVPVKTLYVDDDASEDPGRYDPMESDPNEDGSLANPFDAIQKAIDCAMRDDVILVRDGRYFGPNNVDLDFKGKAITICSENGPDKCVIDGRGQSRVVVFHNSEDPNSILQGFTIKGGYADFGGAVYCEASSPMIADCNFIENEARYDGGAICSAAGAAPTFIGNVFNRNEAGANGGAMRCQASRARIQQSLFAGNVAGANGGALFVLDCPDDGETYAVRLENVSLTGNTAGGGGGAIYCQGRSAVAAHNSILWENLAAGHRGWQIFLRDASEPNLASLVHLSYCDVNETPLHLYCGNDCSIRPDSSVRNNIVADPCFVDPATGDYHLKSTAGWWDPNSSTWVQDDVMSQCIDAGDPSSPLGREIWPHGRTINLGAYGGTTEASLSGNNSGSQHNLNSDPDEIIDFGDLASFVQEWLCGELPLRADFYGDDHEVDFEDFAVFADLWRNVGD